MRKKRLLWHLFPPFLVVVLLAVFAVSWYATRSLRQFYLDETAAELKVSARLVEREVLEGLTSGETGNVDALCKELGRRSGRRITVILPPGEVIGDSEEDPDRMDDHRNRPEIQDAIKGAHGTATRYSHTLQKTMMYVAIPVKQDGRLIGVVRTSIAITSIERALRGIYKRIALVAVVVAIVAALTSLIISRRISRPMEDLERGAERFADGDLASKLAVPGTMEIGRVAEAMNRMAGQLGQRLDTIMRQRNEQEAILASMMEGVFAVDAEERLISINQAASEMLGVDPAQAHSKSIQSIARNTVLQAFVEKALEADEAIEREIALMNEGERFVQVHGAPLRDAGGQRFGAVFVLNDITRLRRLENVRRDFVANVSHELRTPITSIKGFVETLAAGAVKNPPDAERFLGIISKQVDRLNAIIEDLLVLSRLEQDAEQSDIVLERQPLRKPLEDAILACSGKAAEKGISLKLDSADDPQARISSALIEQAVVNLIDNAISFSEPGSAVVVSAAAGEGEALVRVSDSGCGIEEEHLSRIFERFYRADKSRSRKYGGTGLGLAIVKHIAQAHRGSVSVESSPGRGSTFTIHLPSA